MTGDGCVKQLSDPIQRGGRMTEGKVPSRECAVFPPTADTRANFTQWQADLVSVFDANTPQVFILK